MNLRFSEVAHAAVPAPCCITTLRSTGACWTCWYAQVTHVEHDTELPHLVLGDEAASPITTLVFDAEPPNKQKPHPSANAAIHRAMELKLKL